MSESDGVVLPLTTELSRPQPGVVLLAVDGEVDTLTAPRLQVDLDDALDAAGTDAVTVVDLGGVTFLASSGLAVLIYGARRATAVGRRLHLVVATRSVARPLQVTGAVALFDVHADVASALAALAGAAVAPRPGE